MNGLLNAVQPGGALMTPQQFAAISHANGAPNIAARRAYLNNNVTPILNRANQLRSNLNDHIRQVNRTQGAHLQVIGTTQEQLEHDFNSVTDFSHYLTNLQNDLNNGVNFAVNELRGHFAVLNLANHHNAHFATYPLAPEEPGSTSDSENSAH